MFIQYVVYLVVNDLLIRLNGCHVNLEHDFKTTVTNDNLSLPSTAITLNNV